MQYAIKVRDTLTGSATIYTPPIDISNSPNFTGCLIVHAMSGTSPTLDLTPQTSDNLEDWDDLSSGIPQAAATGVYRTSWDASSDDYGRYIRFKVVAAGTNPMVNYSLYINTFPSS